MRTAFLLLVLTGYSLSAPLDQAAQTDEEYVNVGRLRFLRRPQAQQDTSGLGTYFYPSPRLEYYNFIDFTSLGIIPSNNPPLNPFYNPYNPSRPQVYTHYPFFSGGQVTPLIINLRNLA